MSSDGARVRGEIARVSGVNAVTVATAYVLRARRGRTVIQKVRAPSAGRTRG